MSSTVLHDVAIVGAGLAGLTAGARLAERGVRAVVLEKGKDERYPCNARIAGGVFHICFRHVDDDDDLQFRRHQYRESQAVRRPVRRQHDRVLPRRPSGQGRNRCAPRRAP